MKILSIPQIREADKYTIEHEPIESVDLMERAATRAFEWITRRVPRERPVKIFCGMGNNGGDGLVIARLLGQLEYNLQVFIVRHAERMSHDCEVNYWRLVDETRVEIFDIINDQDFPPISPDTVIIDAIFGSGLSRPPQDVTADLIGYLNENPARRIAIDVPSGLFADQPSAIGFIFKADYTLTFQSPKLAFLLPENDPYVGHFEVLDIGLHPQYFNDVETPNFLSDKQLIHPIIHKRPKYSHKGTYGHALLIAGSANMTGAAILGAQACLRTGVGLLTAHLPKAARLPMQVSLPEAIVDTDESDTCFSTFGKLDAFTAIGVGPGLGKAEETAIALKRLINEVQVPLVMDADALNILSENPTWIPFLPAKTILTPHPKEFERLVGKCYTSFERLEKQRELSVKNNIIVVLKGAHTSITLPNGTCFFNTTGNPGMATAGSGDVLTGIILSLLAQRYSPEEAAVLGVYLHGLAGDIAAETLGQEALIASDIIRNIGAAYKII